MAAHQWDAAMRRGYTDTSDGQMHYVCEGSGEPIVLIHGGALSLAEFLSVVPLLGREYCAIALDLPGHGQSDALGKEYTIEDYAESVASFVNSLGVKRASFVGHHASDGIVIELAIQYPHLVDKVILEDCPFYKRPKGGLVLLDMFQCQDPEFKRDGSHLVKDWEHMKGYSPQAPMEVLQQFTVARLLAGSSGVMYYRAAARYDNTDRLGLITQPTLLLSGAGDYFVRNVEEVKERTRRSRIIMIEGADLYASHTHPQEYADAIVDFLRNPQV